MAKYIVIEMQNGNVGTNVTATTVMAEVIALIAQ